MTPAEIKALRLRLGWSQEELARALDTTAQTVHRWETGRRHPQPYFRKALARLAKEKGGAR